MEKRFGVGSAVVCWSMVLSFALAVIVHAQSQGNNPAQKGTAVNHATGAFEIKMTPQKPDNFARMTSDKQWRGDLEGTSKGEMLAIVPDAKGSGVYVALERVTGTLKGRNGSFVLHHTGIMNRGAQELTILVVPDSGTDQLTGIAGKLMIHIAPDGKHSYDFEYTLPDAQ
ncbi:MAG TPA: DUF3224 domain-containing protein [Candidatus Angelobacter sp.]|jgi:hypothetical protein